MTHTLLLADDSVTIQRVIALTFADEDVRVVPAEHGDKVLALLNQSPPDVVLADMDMPGLSGLDLARHIKATPHLAHIPVLLLAGAFDPVEPGEAADAGCAGVLEKPFDPQVLVTRVRELLAAPSAGGSRPPPKEAAAVAHAEPGPAPGELSSEPATELSAQTSVDDYLEQLDAALSAAVRTERPRTPDPEPVDDPAPPSDWLRTPARPPASATPVPRPAASLAEAFAALLDAERTGAPPSAAAQSDLDPAVDAAVRRVLERMSERTLRDMASEILTRVAERIVREEIERIRNETN